MTIEAQKFNSYSPKYFDLERLIFPILNIFGFMKSKISNVNAPTSVLTDNALRRDVGLPELDHQERRFMLYGQDLPDHDFRRMW